MSKSLGLVWIVVAVSAAMLLILASACTREVEVPGETVVVGERGGQRGNDSR